MRLTATVRPVVTARLVDDDAGLPPQHPYVRMFWIPLLGPGAVADLLRLTAAARCGRPLRLPTHLTTLVTEGLVALGRDRTLIVRSTVPRLRVDQIRRLPPEVRRRHLMVR